MSQKIIVEINGIKQTIIPTSTYSTNGWTEIIANIVDGDRVVQKITDLVGGTGVKPSGIINKYIGGDGLLSDIADATDIKGGQGIQGEQGLSGDNGQNGDSAYLYIAWADNDSGDGFTLTFDSSKNFIAVKNTTTPAVNIGASFFSGLWKNYKGEKGDNGTNGSNGTNGTNGTNGASAYVYVAYADDASGAGFTLTFSDTKHYIAIKSTTSPIASPIASDFTGLWVIYSGNPDLSAYLTIANSRFILETITGTTYTLAASKVTANGRYILELSDNSFTSLTLPTPTSLGVTTNDSVQVRITGTYSAQILVAGSGAAIEGTAAFNAQWHTKTLIAKSSTVWAVVG